MGFAIASQAVGAGRTRGIWRPRAIAIVKWRRPGWFYVPLLLQHELPCCMGGHLTLPNEQ